MNRSLRRQPRLTLLTVTVASLVAAACGGGGGGGGSADGGGQIATNSITQENSRATAASALVVMDTLSGAGALAADLPATPKSLDSRAGLSFTRLALDRTRHARSLSTPDYPAGPRPKAVESYTVACSAGGSAKLTLIDADDDGMLSTPDSMLFEFDRCNEADGIVHGLLRLSAFSSNESSGGRSGTDAATIGFENLSITAEGAYSTRSRTAFRSDGGQDCTVMADSIPR